MQTPLEIRVLGDFAVLRAGTPIELPPSRKTRALLAYLAVVGRPQRRERLCEMFWEIPDDPRGALRWSLSKIRQILKPEADGGLQADRNVVSLGLDGILLDIAPLLSLNASAVDGLDTATLEDFAGRFRGGFLDGLTLPRCPDYEAWRVAIADEMEVLRLRILRVLIDRLRESDPARALTHAHALSALTEDGELAAETARLGEAARRTATVVAAPAAAIAVANALPAESAAQIAALSDIAPAAPVAPSPPSLAQEIRSCTTRDGVRIAYAISGKGPPLVKAAHWMSHLDHDWDSPVWRHWISGLSQKNQLIRYDERGNGLSEWDVEDLSFDAMLSDLESIADAAGLRRFCLLGVSQSCAVSVAYAVKHPHRLTGLILYGGYVRGWHARGNEEEIRRREAMGTLIRAGWGQQDPMFRQMFTSLFIPGADQEQMDWFNELQRRTVSPDNALRLHEVFGTIDVSGILSQVAVPTLVIHARDDRVVPIEAGRAFAEAIPGARYVELDSANHILLEREPAFARFLEEVQGFASDPGPAETAPQLAVRLDQSRRQITVMSAEIVSPLQAFESYDPEATLRELSPVLDRVVETIDAHHGVVEISADGGVTAMFGLSRVTEDHAYLACRAALAAHAAVEEVSQGRSRLRVGLDTGDVIVRQRDQRGVVESEVVGAVPRQSGRLMRALRRATIAVSARARAAAEGYIRTVRMAPEDHPSLGRDEQVWELVGENRALSRWHLRSNQGLSGLVGREAEMATLKAAWRRAREGHGQVVGIVADPGLGKSRLVHEFIACEDVAGFAVLESGALEIDADVGLLAIKKLVQSACGLEDGATGALAEQRLARFCQEVGGDHRLLAPLSFLLDLPVTDPEWTQLHASERSLRVRDSVRALLVALSRQMPLVLLIEDLHWIDRASEAVIERLIETVSANRILLILTHRPSYRHEWTRRSTFVQLRLEPFDNEETARFLDQLLGNDESLDSLKPILAQRAENTPLFLEEIVRALEAKGDLVGSLGGYRAPRGVEEVSIPETMRSVIAARIDRLPSQQHRLLQIAAVVGKDVPKALLQSLSSLDAASFEEAMGGLRDQELMFEVQSFPSVEYSFKHAVIHRVAYDTLLEQDRKLIHRSALRAIELLYRDTLTEHVERLAEHALRAEEWEQAVSYCLQAADRATDQTGYDRAARFLEGARRAVDALPPSPDHVAAAIDVRTRMRPVYESIGAFAKAVARLDEARAYAAESGDEPRLLHTLVHQSYLYSAHGRIEEALEAADTLKERAVGHADGLRHICEADLAAAQAHLMRADARAAISRLRPHYEPFTTAWRHERFGLLGVRSVWYLGNLAQAEATLGNFSEAMDAARLARDIAEEVRRPVDVYGARYFGTLVDILRGPSRDLLATLREMSGPRAASPSISMQPWLKAALGHAEYELGDNAAAVATLEAVITDAERFDLPQFECYARALLACARSRLGEPEALANLEYALAQARGRQDHWTEIIVLRGLADTAGGKSAIGYLEEACRLAEENGYRPELARSLLALGLAEQRAGRGSAAATQARAR